MLRAASGAVPRPGSTIEPVTDDLEHTRSVRPAPPPELVEPPAPDRSTRSAPTVVIPAQGGGEPVPIAKPAKTPKPAAEPATPPPATAAAPAPEPPVDTSSVTRPPEPRRPYRIKMTDGVVVALDLTVYLGRRPSVPRIASDRRVRLVAVPSAEKQVSATHLELRQTGDAVVATDMRSTNGSTVIVPGSKPRTLLRGESVVVTPGTLIDLGDGNVLEMLSPERLTADPASRGDAGA